MSRRQSMFSNGSGPLLTPQATAPLTTSSLIAALHNAYQASTPFQIDAGTSLVVVSALASPSGNGGTMMSGMGSTGAETIDSSITARAWEHARRRAEDQCIVVTSLSPSTTPALLAPIISSFPQASPLLVTVLNTVRPFFTALSPLAPQASLHHGLVLTQHISLSGEPSGCSIALTPRGINVDRGLLKIPSEVGYRAFDVFYYLLSTTSSTQEREYLSLQNPEDYALLRRSGTYTPPAWLPTADDAASAEDFRSGLRQIGIKGSLLRGVLSILAGLLKLGNILNILDQDSLVEETCEDVGGLLGVEPDVLVKLGPDERERFIAAAYESLVNWIISKANSAMEADFTNKKDGRGSVSSDEDTVAISFVEIPSDAHAKAVCLRHIFDDDLGLNAEMKEDGVECPVVNSAVLRELRQAIETQEGNSAERREEEYERDRREGTIERVGREVESAGFLRTVLFPQENNVRITKHEINAVLSTSRVWYHLSLSPNDMSTGEDRSTTPSMTLGSGQGWSAACISRQVRSWRLTEWSNRRNKHIDFTADFDFEEMAVRYASLGCQAGRDGVESWVMERGWSNGEVFVGKERVWMREGSWWEAETMLDLKPPMGGVLGSVYADTPGSFPGYSRNDSGFFPPMGTGSAYGDAGQTSRDNLLLHNGMGQTGFINRPMSVASPPMSDAMAGRGMHEVKYDPDTLADEEVGDRAVLEKEEASFGRRVWVGFVWACTFFIPSHLLRWVGRMKRPDVRFAWREKVVLFFLIMLFNAMVIFYIVGLGHVLCPKKNKVWNLKEVGYHSTEDDYYAAVHGKVYDLTNFWQRDHSDITGLHSDKETMLALAGQDLSSYFPIPLRISCPAQVLNDTVQLQQNITNAPMFPQAIHKSGPYQNPYTSSKLYDINWYPERFLSKQNGITQFLKGDLVIEKEFVEYDGRNNNHEWFTMDGYVYDLGDYYYTLQQFPTVAGIANPYNFIDSEFMQLLAQNLGGDLTEKFNTIMTPNARANLKLCLNLQFKVATVDFRKTAQCTVNNWILLSFAVILCAVIGIKFIAALQLGPKRVPSMQDKFVICQIPAYTEGEDSLRKALDSLTALNYENKRKLLFVICDGLVTGGGNDKSTPQIVLDILGVDPKIDPPSLPFKSVGEGSQQLNYGKVYSGLYEFEGRVVPYIVVVKVGRPNETSKPGNRGKRDSQVLLMSFLNRVHHRTAMNPLELELFHQINNVIGVDPELYEYLMMVDADTCVREDALNRLVASCVNNSKIAGICGETSLENEERSWWTMIQVYEYYISHHLAKSFESLFGSVTCLPGCFCMYRLRTADKGKPLIISSKVIEEYQDGNVDTLHKKNLLSLGEDRYLTTLMTKHFPYMSFKFIPDAYAQTAAPETWSVLLSQRRRWINSTIHNLVELMFLKEMCGFCLFSMRFVVFIDLFGTILLPSTCAYLAYLIYLAASKSGQFPLISLIMLAVVYGLQAVIFIVKRQWQHIGWMIIYLIAYPIYSFVLPLYSFWQQDDFSWGNTRIVVGEKGAKKIVAVADEGFNPASIPLQTWDDYATASNLPGRRNAPVVDKYYDEAGAYEMDDIHSVYSSVKPASTLHFNGGNPYLAPGGGSPMGNRQSSYSTIPEPYLGGGGGGGGGSVYNGNRSTYQQPPSPGYPPARSPLAYASRPASTMDFVRGNTGPDDATIVEVIRDCLANVDLDNVTKKQVRALVEQRLQTELNAERRAFMDRAIDAELAMM